MQARKGSFMARFSTLANCRLSFRFCLLAVFTTYTIVGNFGPTQAASAAPTRVVIGYPSPTPRVAPLWIAQDLDFFGKYGLTAQLVLVRNNQMLTAGLAAGDITRRLHRRNYSSWRGGSRRGVEIGRELCEPRERLSDRTTGYQESGGFGRETHWRAKHWWNSMDVRYAYSRTARIGYDAGSDSLSS